MAPKVIHYSCFICKTEDRGIALRPRSLQETIDNWMELEAIPAVIKEHKARHPACWSKQITIDDGEGISTITLEEK